MYISAPGYQHRKKDGRTNPDTCVIPECCIYTSLLAIQPRTKATVVCILDRTAGVEVVGPRIAVTGLDRASESIGRNRKPFVGIGTRRIDGAAWVGMEGHRVKNVCIGALHNMNFASRWRVGSGQID